MGYLEDVLRGLRSCNSKILELADVVAQALEAAEVLEKTISDAAGTADPEFIADQERRSQKLKGRLAQAAAEVEGV